ncbi:MAG: hypothetical protein RugAbin2_02159 [Rugosibacter sp.]|jgi:type I restriction enzyme R subunit|nr:hypothetical protein [Rugosibacter sp.]
MSLHKEISFESEICEHLASHGWLYAEGDAAGYDRARALFPADALAWAAKNLGNPHRRSPTRHRPAARTPHRADLRRRDRPD